MSFVLTFFATFFGQQGLSCTGTCVPSEAGAGVKLFLLDRVLMVGAFVDEPNRDTELNSVFDFTFW